MRFVLLAVVLLSCAGSSAAVSNAVINTALGVTMAGASRASGGCYAACPLGTRCEPKTGLCEELPCRGRCRSDERCETVSGLPQCMPVGSLASDLVIVPRKPAPDAAK
jgi:hypothetical protein